MKVIDSGNLTPEQMKADLTKKIYDLGLLDSIPLPNLTILRVPGGWMFIMNVAVGTQESTSPIMVGPAPSQKPQLFCVSEFVPYNDEFNPRTLDQIATQMGKDSDEFYALKTDDSKDPANDDSENPASDEYLEGIKNHDFDVNGS